MVLGYASELDENEALPQPEREKARIIRRQGEKLRNLINDLNLVSMLEYEMQPLKRKRIKLSALARRVVSDVLNEGLEEKYALELDVADRGAIICGDESLLLRALNNLVHNSIRHNPEGCRILVQTAGSPDQGFCSIRVSDDGKGIPPDDLPDLTQLPYSSKRKRPAPHGHGLGLPMVARIAKAHQGKLVLRSEPGRGLTAEIRLPRTDSGPGA
jgi:signal transduction histidine kinase